MTFRRGCQVGRRRSNRDPFSLLEVLVVLFLRNISQSRESDVGDERRTRVSFSGWGVIKRVRGGGNHVSRFTL